MGQHSRPTQRPVGIHPPAGCSQVMAQAAGQNHRQVGAINKQTGNHGFHSPGTGVPRAGVALILGVDRILDMLRTSANVTGDATVAVLVNASEAKANG